MSKITPPSFIIYIKDGLLNTEMNVSKFLEYPELRDAGKLIISNIEAALKLRKEAQSKNTVTTLNDMMEPGNSFLKI